MNAVFFNEYIQTSPRFMTDFTPWTLFVDTGIISVLLLLGKLMRVKIRFIQRLFIPPSLLAGFIGLSLGPHGFGIIPLSTQTGTYAGILIAFIFGALPLTSQKAAKGDADNIGSMWAYSQAGMLLQWAFGGLLGLLVLNRIWPLNPAFGITMPSGYCGGHGTAAAIGQAFSQFGYDEILTLAMTAATFGIVAAVIIGLIIFVVGIFIKKIFDKTRTSDYVCPQTIGHISGAFTDFLVAFGIASIKISVVIEYIIPLLILLVSGLIATLIYVLVMARKLMKECWFEKAIFTWGWFTGTMAMGIALLRVADPKMRSRCLDNYALAYLFIAPVEISLITFAPVAFLNGYGLVFTGICLAAGLAVLATAYIKGWFIRKQ